MEKPKVIREAIDPQAGILRESNVEESQDCLRELFESLVITVVGDVLMHDFPTGLDRIKIGAIGRQMVQLNA